MNWRFWRSKPNNSDLDDELAYDLAADAEERIRSGTSREEAESASRRDFGNVQLLKEDIREIWGWTSLQRLGQDVRYGWRTFSNHPLFTAMAVLSLALGIGANTAIYSVMDAIMMRALPVQNPAELAIPNWRAKDGPSAVHSHSGSRFAEPGGGVTSPDFPWPAYELFRSHTDLFSDLFAYKDAGRLNLLVHGQAELGDVEFISGNFFKGLGLVPAAGRLIADSDNFAGTSQVAVLSYSYWQTHFAGDPAAVGQTISINNLPFTIAGVAAPEFFGLRPGSAPVLYIPIANRPALATNHGNEQTTMFTDPKFYWVAMMGRLRPGITLARAQAELAVPFHHIASISAENDKERANLPSLWMEEGGSGIDALRRQYSKPLFVLMTMVAFILAIACANIANLLLARATTRRREIAVRLSLGASRLRVLRQLLTESLLLALPGGILGLGIGAIGIRFLLWLLAGNSETFSLRAQLDWRILAFTIGVALATGILFGLAPAVAATRVDITPALKETRASAPRTHGRIGLSQFLVVLQITLSLLLVLGAALFVRTLANLHSVELGFNQEKLLTFSLYPGQAGYKDAALKTFYARLEEQFRALPGVRAATESDMPLVANWNSSTNVVLPSGLQPIAGGNRGTSDMSVGPAFFETIQIPIVLGRPLDSHDAAGAPLVAVVNEVFAKNYFPNLNPIGQHFKLGDKDGAGDWAIVGVAKNARYSSLKRAIPPVAYVPYLQNVFKHQPPAMIFALRTAGDPRSLEASVRKVVHDIAPRVPVTDMMTQTQRIDSTITQERTFADLCTAFAVLALIIACVGLYGTMAYLVARRTNEIGIRIALGAERHRIVWMVLREVLGLAAVGLAIGLVCAWSTLSAIKSFVFGIKATDPLAILIAAGILVAALILAGLAPATRASRIDPLTALRHE